MYTVINIIFSAILIYLGFYYLTENEEKLFSKKDKAKEERLRQTTNLKRLRILIASFFFIGTFFIELPNITILLTGDLPKSIRIISPCCIILTFIICFILSETWCKKNKSSNDIKKQPHWFHQISALEPCSLATEKTQ